MPVVRDSDRTAVSISQVVRDFDIRAKTEEYVSGLTGLVFLAPDPAVAEIRNCAYAVV